MSIHVSYILDIYQQPEADGTVVVGAVLRRSGAPDGSVPDFQAPRFRSTIRVAKECQEQNPESVELAILQAVQECMVIRYSAHSHSVTEDNHAKAGDFVRSTAHIKT